MVTVVAIGLEYAVCATPYIVFMMSQTSAVVPTPAARILYLVSTSMAQIHKVISPLVLSFTVPELRSAIWRRDIV